MGGIRGTQTVTVSHDDTAVNTEALTIRSEATGEVSVLVTESGAGDYEYIVNINDEGTTASATVAEPETDFDKESDVDVDDSGADNLDGSPGFDVVSAMSV